MWEHTAEYTAYKYESGFGFEMIRPALCIRIRTRCEFGYVFVLAKLI